MNSDIPVSISVTDIAKIIGFGTGDPCSERNFFDDTQKLFNGRAFTIIKGKEKGSCDC